MMSGGGGYLLTGIFVDNTEPERSTENGQVKFEKKNQGRKRQRNWNLSLKSFHFLLNKSRYAKELFLFIILRRFSVNSYRHRHLPFIGRICELFFLNGPQWV